MARVTTLIDNWRWSQLPTPKSFGLNKDVAEKPHSLLNGNQTKVSVLVTSELERKCRLPYINRVSTVGI